MVHGHFFTSFFIVEEKDGLTGIGIVGGLDQET
jgi:hypothetical protein